MKKYQNLKLVPHGTSFLESTHHYASDLENTRYMVHLPNKTIEETKRFLEGIDAEWKKEEAEFYEFAILLDEKHIGAACAYLDDSKTSAELGWIIDKAYWGNGYAYEAARRLVDFCKEQHNIKHFIAHCDSENVGSYRVMEKLGMTLKQVNEGRKNRASDELRREFQYEMCI